MKTSKSPLSSLLGFLLLPLTIIGNFYLVQWWSAYFGKILTFNDLVYLYGIMCLSMMTLAAAHLFLLLIMMMIKILIKKLKAEIL